MDSPEAALRAELTGLMQESALLTGLALAEIVEADGDAAAPGPAGVLAAVDENTVALSEAMEPTDEAAQAEFGEVWGSHIGDFVDYTTALVDDDAAGIDAAQAPAGGVPGRSRASCCPTATRPSPRRPWPRSWCPTPSRSWPTPTPRVAEAAGAEPIESAQLLREAALAMRLAARTFAGGLTRTDLLKGGVTGVTRAVAQLVVGSVDRGGNAMLPGDER